MTRSAKIGLLLLVLLALGAGGWYLYDNFSSHGPDRTEEVREYLKQFLYDPTDLQILSCRQVNPRGLAEVRAEYPTLEIVDCYFRHKDPIGQMQDNRHHFFLLDGKVFYCQGLTFQEAHGVEADPKSTIKGIVEKNSQPRDREAQKAMMMMTKGGKGGMGGMGGMKGKGGGFPGKGKGMPKADQDEPKKAEDQPPEADDATSTKEKEPGADKSEAKPEAKDKDPAGKADEKKDK